MKLGILLAAPDNFHGLPLELKLNAKNILSNLPGNNSLSFFRDRVRLNLPRVNPIARIGEETMINFIIGTEGNGKVVPYYRSTGKFTDDMLAAIGSFHESRLPFLGSCLNEEDNVMHYSGTGEQYIDNMLIPFVKVMHANRIKATNGGLTAEGACYAVYLDMVDRKAGLEAKNWADRTGITPKLGYLKKKEALIRYLIGNYGRSGIDYISFHWYSRDVESALTVISYLSATSGVPAIITEYGNLTEPGMLLRLPIDIGIFYCEGAWQLFEADGSLNRFGRALKNGVLVN